MFNALYVYLSVCNCITLYSIDQNSYIITNSPQSPLSPNSPTASKQPTALLTNVNHGGTVCESLHNDSRGQSSFTPKQSKPSFAPEIEDGDIVYNVAATSFDPAHVSKKQKTVA